MKAKPSPEITYIVSAYNRPVMLAACLWSLVGQSHQDFEIIVTDNAVDEEMAKKNRTIIEQLNDAGYEITYVRTAKKIKVSDCYWSAEWAIEHLARGRWLCFPNDDMYYVPQFAQRMLTAAAKGNLDFVLCGTPVVSPLGAGRSREYQLWDLDMNSCIKTAFIVKASFFEGFKGKPHAPGSAAADTGVGFEVVRRHGKWGIVNEVLMVHN